MGRSLAPTDDDEAPTLQAHRFNARIGRMPSRPPALPGPPHDVNSTISTEAPAPLAIDGRKARTPDDHYLIYVEQDRAAFAADAPTGGSRAGDEGVRSTRARRRQRATEDRRLVSAPRLRATLRPRAGPQRPPSGRPAGAPGPGPLPRVSPRLRSQRQRHEDRSSSLAPTSVCPAAPRPLWRLGPARAPARPAHRRGLSRVPRGRPHHDRKLMAAFRRDGWTERTTTSGRPAERTLIGPLGPVRDACGSAVFDHRCSP